MVGLVGMVAISGLSSLQDVNPTSLASARDMCYREQDTGYLWLGSVGTPYCKHLLCRFLSTQTSRQIQVDGRPAGVHHFHPAENVGGGSVGRVRHTEDRDVHIPSMYGV